MSSTFQPPAEHAVFEPIASAADACAIKLQVFDGPLDLLLHLIRQNELDITNLPIARIAEQYLEYVSLMHELRLEIAAEYLVMAATLAWIKSRLLLPSDEAEEEEGGDPRAELVARLLEYQRFKEAADALGERPRLGRDVFEARGAAPEPRPEAEREIEVGLFELIEALRRVLRAQRGAGAVHELMHEPITVHERMTAVMEALAEAESVQLETVLRGPEGRPATRALIVATFLAILELARIAALRLFQSLDEHSVPTGPIRLRRVGAPGDDGWRERADAEA